MWRSTNRSVARPARRLRRAAVSVRRPIDITSLLAGVLAVVAGCGPRTGQADPPPATRPANTLPSAHSSAATSPATVPISVARRAPVADAPARIGDLQRFEYHQLKLGSDFNLVFYAADQSTADAAAAAAYAEVDRYDVVLNDYSATSEISRLSQKTLDGSMAAPTEISPELADVLGIALSAARLTDGVFDPTIGPFVQLWRRSRRLQQLPTPERIAEARQAFGYRNVHLVLGVAADNKRPTAQLMSGKMRLDLGGIAGGYIADRVLAVLKSRGISSALVDSSGDLAVGDPPPGKSAWRVAIAALTEPNKPAGFIDVANCGVSSSGDTYRVVVIGGVRYSHIVDAKTGLGLTHSLGVTTIAADATTADWLATAISVLGPGEGLKLLDRTEEPFRQAGARVTTLDTKGQPVVVESPRFAAMHVP
jgi:thiamine biosynthesis lipoprotein